MTWLFHKISMWYYFRWENFYRGMSLNISLFIEQLYLNRGKPLNVSLFIGKNFFYRGMSLNISFFLLKLFTSIEESHSIFHFILNNFTSLQECHQIFQFILNKFNSIKSLFGGEAESWRFYTSCCGWVPSCLLAGNPTRTWRTSIKECHSIFHFLLNNSTSIEECQQYFIFILLTL